MKAKAKKKVTRKKAVGKDSDRFVEREYCDFCDGCGWYEGGAYLRTECPKCHGEGSVIKREVEVSK